MEKVNLLLISKYNNWSIEFTKKVFIEYFRFLELRNKNEKLSPSDPIDKFWHTHILDTKSYQNFCIEKFGKVIHHNPFDSFDQNARTIRLSNTINQYKQTFGSMLYPEIWNCSTITKNTNKPDSKPEQNKTIISNSKFNYPTYNTNLFDNKNQIKIFIFYSFDDGNLQPFSEVKRRFDYKKWRPNDFKFDQKILTINETSNPISFNNVKKYIEKLTGHQDYGIEIYPHPEYQKIINANNKKNTITNKKSQFPFANDINSLSNDYLEVHKPVLLGDDLPINSSSNPPFPFYIAELVEITSNGFC